MEPNGDRKLLARVHAGSPDDAREALRELYERHAPEVGRFLRRIVNRADAEDLLHETFLAAARNAAGFRAGSALPWLLTIAARRARDHLRGETQRARHENAAAADRGPAVGLPGSTALEAALERLPARVRAVVELRFTRGFTHAQVAEVLGVSLRTAKSWSAAALDELRAELEAER